MAVQPIIPPEWPIVYTLTVGQDWPQADEDAIRRCAQAWTDALAGLVEISGAGGQATQNVHYSVQAVSSDQFDQYWQQYTAGDDSAVGQLAQQCQMLAEQLLSFAEQTEFTKISIDIQIIILLIQVIYDFVISPLTGGLSMGEAFAAMFFTRTVVRDILAKLIEAVIMAVLPDLITQGIMLAEGHRSQIDVGELAQSAQMGLIGGLVGMGAGKMLGGLGKGLENSLGKRVGGLVSAGVTGAITNVGTNMAVSAVDNLENPNSSGYADQKSSGDLLSTIANGAFTGMLFHGIHEMGQKPAVTFHTSDGTFKGVQTGDNAYTLFPEKGDNAGRLHLATLNDDGTLRLTQPPLGATTEVTPSGAQVVHDNATMHYSFGADGQPTVTHVEQVVTGRDQHNFTNDGQPWTPPKDSTVTYVPDKGPTQVVVPVDGTKQAVYAGNGDSSFSLVGHQQQTKDGGYAYFGTDPNQQVSSTAFRQALNDAQQTSPTHSAPTAADQATAVAPVPAQVPPETRAASSEGTLAEALRSPAAAAPADFSIQPMVSSKDASPVAPSTPAVPASPLEPRMSGSEDTTVKREPAGPRGTGDTTVKRSTNPRADRSSSPKRPDPYATVPDPEPAGRRETSSTMDRTAPMDPYKTQLDVYATRPEGDASSPGLGPLELAEGQENVATAPLDPAAEARRRATLADEATELFDGQTGRPLWPEGERILREREAVSGPEAAYDGETGLRLDDPDFAAKRRAILENEQTALYVGETGRPLGPKGERIQRAQADTEVDPTVHRLRGPDSGEPGVHEATTVPEEPFDPYTGRRRGLGSDDPTAPMGGGAGDTTRLASAGDSDVTPTGESAVQQEEPHQPGQEPGEQPSQQPSPEDMLVAYGGQPTGGEGRRRSQYPPWKGDPSGKVVAAPENERAQFEWLDYEQQGRAFRDNELRHPVPALQYGDDLGSRAYFDGLDGRTVLYDAKMRIGSDSVDIKQARRQQASLEYWSQRSGENHRMRLEVSDLGAAANISKQLAGLDLTSQEGAQTFADLLAAAGIADPAAVAEMRERITGLQADNPTHEQRIRQLLGGRMSDERAAIVLERLGGLELSTPDGRQALTALLDDYGVHDPATRGELVDRLRGLDASRPDDRARLDTLLRQHGAADAQRTEILGRLRGLDRIDVVYVPQAEERGIGVPVDDPEAGAVMADLLSGKGLPDAEVGEILRRLRGVDLSIPDGRMRMSALLDDHHLDDADRADLLARFGQLNRPASEQPPAAGGRADQAEIFARLDADEMAAVYRRLTFDPTVGPESQPLRIVPDPSPDSRAAALYGWDAAVSYGSYQRGVKPALRYVPEGNARPIVRFDALDGGVLVDRKLSGVDEGQARRQHRALSQNDMTARWEFPTNAAAENARDALTRWGLNDGRIQVRVVEFDPLDAGRRYQQWAREQPPESTSQLVGFAAANPRGLPPGEFVVGDGQTRHVVAQEPLQPANPGVTRPLQMDGPINPNAERLARAEPVLGISPVKELPPADSPEFERLWKAMWHATVETSCEHALVRYAGEEDWRVVKGGMEGIYQDPTHPIAEVAMHVHPPWKEARGISEEDAALLVRTPDQEMAVLVQPGGLVRYFIKDPALEPPMPPEPSWVPAPQAGVPAPASQQEIQALAAHAGLVLQLGENGFLAQFRNGFELSPQEQHALAVFLDRHGQPSGGLARVPAVTADAALYHEQGEGQPDPTEVAERYGIPVEMQQGFQRVAERYGVVIDLRPSNPEAAAQRLRGAVPKPEDIKAKSLEPRDSKLNPFPESSLALIRGIAPGKPVRMGIAEDAPGREQLARDYDKAFTELEEFYRKRAGEWQRYHLGEQIQELTATGQWRVRQGVVERYIAGEWRRVTGDQDLFDIRRPDGTRLSPLEERLIREDLISSGLSVQHGAHMYWENPGAKRAVFQDVFTKHQPGGEPLVRILPGERPRLVWAGRPDPSDTRFATPEEEILVAHPQEEEDGQSAEASRAQFFEALGLPRTGSSPAPPSPWSEESLWGDGKHVVLPDPTGHTWTEADYRAPTQPLEPATVRRSWPDQLGGVPLAELPVQDQPTLQPAQWENKSVAIFSSEDAAAVGRAIGEQLNAMDPQELRRQGMLHTMASAVNRSVLPGEHPLTQADALTVLSAMAKTYKPWDGHGDVVQLAGGVVAMAPANPGFKVAFLVDPYGFVVPARNVTWSMGYYPTDPSTGERQRDANNNVVFIPTNLRIENIGEQQ